MFFCFVFVIVHNFFDPHFPIRIRIRYPQVSSPRFADTSFASRLFELFTLPASLKLNTQRRSAPSMHAFKEEERSFLISVTLMKGITGYKTVPTIGITFCMLVKGPKMWQRLERKISFPCLFVCLFIYYYYYFLLSAFLVFSLLLFLLSAFFFHPHFSICIFPSASAIRGYPVRVLQTPVANPLLRALPK